MNRKSIIFFALILFLVALYFILPGRTILDVTKLDLDVNNYQKILIQEYGFSNSGAGVRTEYITDDKKIMQNLMEYMNSYELKRWFNKSNFAIQTNSHHITLVSKDNLFYHVNIMSEYYVVINNRVYWVTNKENIDREYLNELLMHMEKIMSTNKENNSL